MTEIGDSHTQTQKEMNVKIEHRWWIAGAGAAAITLLVSAGAVMAQTPSGTETPTASETPAAGSTTPDAQQTPDGGAPTVQPNPGERPGGCGLKGVGLTELATFLGTDEATLRTELQAEGATLATVSATHGQSREALIAFLTEQFQARVAEKVAAGGLTQAEADERIAQFTENVGDMVDATGGMRFRGHHGGGPHGGDLSPQSEAAPTGGLSS